MEMPSRRENSELCVCFSSIICQNQLKDAQYSDIPLANKGSIATPKDHAQQSMTLRELPAVSYQ